jgi:hypothetical protein
MMSKIDIDLIADGVVERLQASFLSLPKELKETLAESPSWNGYADISPNITFAQQGRSRRRTHDGTHQ